MKSLNLLDDSPAPESACCLQASFPAPDLYFQFIVEQLGEIVFTLDAEGHFTYLNPAWQERTGYPVSESLGQSICSFIHPDDVFQCSGHVQSDAPHSSFETRFWTKDGQNLWVEVSLKIVGERQDAAFKMGSMADVTERVQAAQALLASKERFRLAATASNDGIWDWNLVTDEIFFSPRLKEMLGYADDELENCYATWYEHIHPDDLDNAIHSLMSCLGGENNFYENVYRLKTKYGGWRWILDRGAIMRDAEGRGVRITGSHADITRLKVLEDELFDKQNQLNTLFGLSPDGIVTFTVASTVSSVSPSFLSMTGFSSEELVGLPQAEFDAKMASITTQDLTYEGKGSQPYPLLKIFPLQHEAADVSFAGPQGEALPGMPPSLASASLAFDRQTVKTLSLEPHDGSLPPDAKALRILKVMVFELIHESISKVIYFRDVTLESQVDRIKNDFLSTAAHELRTPMTSIYGYTELLLTNQFNKKTSREMLGIVKNQASILLAMVNDLLDIAKIEAGAGKTFKFLPQSLAAVTRKAVQEFMATVDDQERHVDISNKGYWVSIDEPAIDTRLDDENYWVCIDADQIKRALTNILGNAFKYSPLGAEISVKLSQRKTANGREEVGVRVKDNGVGMSAEQVQHVYERFWRGSNVQHIEGTGLGMSLVKEIMDIHQAVIEIDTAPHQGTEISLWFQTVSASGEQ